MRCPAFLLILLLFAAPALAQSASEDALDATLDEADELDDDDFADFLPGEAVGDPINHQRDRANLPPPQ